MKRPDIILCEHCIICEHCIGAIRSRGEKVIKGDSLYFNENITQDMLTCEWCEEEFEPSQIYECWF